MSDFALGSYAVRRSSRVGQGLFDCLILIAAIAPTSPTAGMPASSTVGETSSPPATGSTTTSTFEDTLEGSPMRGSWSDSDGASGTFSGSTPCLLGGVSRRRRQR